MKRMRQARRCTALVLGCFGLLAVGCGEDRAKPEPEQVRARAAPVETDAAAKPEAAAEPEAAALPENSFEFVNAFPKLRFKKPLHLVTASGGGGRFYVIEQRGRVHWFDSNRKTPKKIEALDLSDRISRRGWEEGLLGIALHPHFTKNRQMFLFYTVKDPARNRLSRFWVHNKTGIVDPESEEVLLEIPKPNDIHNGGSLQFGPDGYLYFSIGDGGPPLVPLEDPQDLNGLYGKILRIDVDRKGDSTPYAIPEDNPFVGRADARGEVWAYGLRNVWRFSFDPVTQMLWAADVGYYRADEVDIIEKGKNYGWPMFEATIKYRKPPEGFDLDTLEMPLVEHKQEEARSLIGGHVYRGDRFADLVGAYVYGDFITGKFWALTTEGHEVRAHTQILQNTNKKVKISSIGVDEQGELYFTSRKNGVIYVLRRIQPDSGDASG